MEKIVRPEVWPMTKLKNYLKAIEPSSEETERDKIVEIIKKYFEVNGIKKLLDI